MRSIFSTLFLLAVATAANATYLFSDFGGAGVNGGYGGANNGGLHNAPLVLNPGPLPQQHPSNSNHGPAATSSTYRQEHINSVAAVVIPVHGSYGGSNGGGLASYGGSAGAANGGGASGSNGGGAGYYGYNYGNGAGAAGNGGGTYGGGASYAGGSGSSDHGLGGYGYGAGGSH